MNQCNKVVSHHSIKDQLLLTKQEGLHKILKCTEQKVAALVDVLSGFRQRNVQTCCLAQS